MSEIKYIEMKLTPEYYISATQPPIAKYSIIVKIAGKPELVINKLIHDNDLKSRFDLYIEDMIRILKKELMED